jgi:hypothetical protein
MSACGGWRRASAAGRCSSTLSRQRQGDNRARDRKLERRRRRRRKAAMFWRSRTPARSTSQPLQSAGAGSGRLARVTAAGCCCTRCWRWTPRTASVSAW